MLKHKNFKYYRIILKVSSVFLLFLVVFILISDYSNLIDILRKLNINWLILGISAYYINFIFRGVRLKLLIDSKNYSFWDAVYSSTSHGIFTYFLPLKSGDISLPLFLKSTGNINIKDGFIILMKTRLLDISVLGFISLWASIYGIREISTVIRSIWIFASTIMVLSYFLIQKISWISSYVINKILKSDIDFTKIFELKIQVVIVSFFIWGLIFISQYCMILSIGMNLDFPEIVFISAIQIPLQMSPVQGVANTGNHEGAWVTALVCMGFEPKTAISYALISHGVLIIYVTSLILLAVFSSRNFRNFLNTYLFSR